MKDKRALFVMGLIGLVLSILVPFSNIQPIELRYLMAALMLVLAIKFFRAVRQNSDQK